MKLVDKKGFFNNNCLDKIKNGAVFIYPTDTIYGLGCDATNEKAVEKIRKLKKRDKKPFSVIAPSKSWIIENCFIDEKNKKFLSKLPGKYTMILRLKNNGAVAKNVSQNTIGVRIPNNWFSDVVKKINMPIVTTSVNFSGGDFMTSIETGNKEILELVDFVIYEGEKSGNPSTIIDLTGEKAKIIKR